MSGTISPGRTAPLHRAPRRWGQQALVAPVIALIGWLVIYPTIKSIYNSFRTDSPLQQTDRFVGLHNYQFVLGDQAFLQAAKNSGWYLLFGTALSLVLGLAMAMWLHTLRHGRGVALIMVVLPWAVPGTVTGMLWSFLLNPTASGLFNTVLMRLHIISEPIVWMYHPVVGIFVITLAMVWQTVPIAALILYAGLASIPHELSESARVDGAGALSEFFRITVPLLRPALAISMLNAGIMSIGIFDQMFVLNGYAPATMTVVGELYTYSFLDFQFGFGIAASVFVTLATLVLSLFYLKVIYREVTYT